MPFRLFREPLCAKKVRDKEVEKIYTGYYWSEDKVRSKMIISFLELFFAPIGVIFCLCATIKFFILVNTEIKIDPIWAIINIFVLGAIGLLIILLLLFYRKWFTMLCLGCIKLKFYRLDSYRYSDENHSLLNKYIQNEWGHLNGCKN